MTGAVEQESGSPAAAKGVVGQVGACDFNRLLSQGQSVLVAGLGLSGRAVAQILTAAAVPVITVDEGFGGHGDTSGAALAADLNSFEQVDWERVGLVVTSPAFPPRSPFLQVAASRSIPVWSEVEFAWRTRVTTQGQTVPAPWIGITGTNGKTTTTEMTAAIMSQAGFRAPAVGNIGQPVSQAVLDPSNQALCVELSSFALHFTASLALDVAVWTNIADDHIDWHGGFDKYAADKAKVFERARRAIVFNADDPVVAAAADRVQLPAGCLKVGFTLAAPTPGQIGVQGGQVVDWSGLAAAADRLTVAGSPAGQSSLPVDRSAFPPSPLPLLSLSELGNLAEPDGTVYPHLLADVLAALAATRAMGVPLTAARQALTAFSLDSHRIQLVASAQLPGSAQPVRFVDDSKATNAHAAAASLSSFPDGSVIWLAGGLAKGARFEELVSQRRSVMKAVVLIGTDQTVFTQALAAQAPDLPVSLIDPADRHSVMRRAVEAAMTYAKPGDVVLLAPATASMDQFDSYADRGDQFAACAREWVRTHG